MTQQAINQNGLNSQEIASELNNLLQVIAGTSEALENIWEGQTDAAHYFQMLRESVARAAEVTTDLVERSGRLNGKLVMPAEFTRRIPNVAHEAPPKQRIMLVDDERMLLIITRELLQDEGYEVVTAESGFECLDHFRREEGNFDLVLLDLNMPLMDGEETFQRLRAIQPDLRVMLCTGYVQQDRLNHMLECGLAGFVQKPLGPREYLERVRTALVPNESTQPA